MPICFAISGKRVQRFFDEKSQTKTTYVTFISRISKDISICQEGFFIEIISCIQMKF